MEAVTVWVACVAAALSVSLALVLAIGWRASVRRNRAEIAALRARLDGLDAARSRRASRVRPVTTEPVAAEFLITDAGTEPHEPEVVSSRLVLSATIGEPLVKVASFAYGVRVALTPENRNRIRFEMRREIKRARKARRAAGRAAAAQARSQAVRS